MKVMVVHNRYRSALPSGENVAVDAEVELLRGAGVEVVTFFRDSDEIASMSLGRRAVALTSPITGWSSSSAFAEALRTERPDVVHLHNPYPLLSPTVIDASIAADIPVVATVHNYRLQCPSGVLFRDGASCTECVGRSFALPAVVHGCYRDSRTQSMAMAVALRRHRSSWDGVTRFVAVSSFVAQWLQRTGVASDRISVIPNAVSDPGVSNAVGRGFLHAARLSAEKGTELLLDAWAASGLDGRERLVIAGDGPLRPLVESAVSSMQSIEYVGVLDAEALVSMRVATAVSVMPSLCDDPLTSAPESFALARPVIATRNGGLAELVDDEVGWSVTGDVDGLAAALRAACDPSDIARRGSAARARYDVRHRPDVVLAMRRALYADVVR